MITQYKRRDSSPAKMPIVANVQQQGRAECAERLNPPPTRLRVEQRVSDKWQKSKS